MPVIVFNYFVVRILNIEFIIYFPYSGRFDVDNYYRFPQVILMLLRFSVIFYILSEKNRKIVLELQNNNKSLSC